MQKKGLEESTNQKRIQTH